MTAPFDNVPLALTVLLPLLSAAASAALSKRRAWLSPLLSVAFMLISLFFALLVFANHWGEGTLSFAWNWFYLGNQAIAFSLELTPVTLLMLLVVPLISFFVHVYSMGYMVGEAGIRRYFAALGFFTFSMLGLVLAGNLLQMFFFWELVGLSSYLLIGHWRERPSAAAAATKAFVMNRIGDAGLLVAMCLLWREAGTLSFAELETISWTNNGWQVAIGLLILLGVAGKSAQFPLLTWLPDAMEGPTPVSALIHAATMVAAGVFLLVRVHVLLPETTLTVIAATGALTSIYGAWYALRHTDIKKVLAYSTLSQLGLMVMGIGAGAWSGSFFHLFTHAFFKACLFLAAGVVIHHLHNLGPDKAQNLLFMGGLRRQLPATFLAFVAAGAALAGLPFFSGFLSKEALLLQLISNRAWVWVVVFFAVSFATVWYTYRLIYLIFARVPRVKYASYPHPTPAVMLFPVVILALCSMWPIAGINPFETENWLLRGLSIELHSNDTLALASVLWVVLALASAHFFFRNRLPVSTGDSQPWLDQCYQKIIRNGTLRTSVAIAGIDRKWIDCFLHALVIIKVTLAYVVAWFDRNVVDGTVRGIAWLSQGVGNLLRWSGGNSVQTYVLGSVIALVIFLFWLLK